MNDLMIPRVGIIVWMAVAVSSSLTAAERLPAPGELEAIFQPFRTERATLAPDGRHLAYTVREDRQVRIVIADIDQPGGKISFVVGDEAGGRRGATGAQLKSLLWANANQLAYNMSVPAAGRRPARDEVRVVDADGKNDRKLVDSHDLHIVTLAGVMPRPPGMVRLNRLNPETVFVGVGPEAAPNEIYRVELATGKFASLRVGGSAPGKLLHDQQGRAQLALTPPFRIPEQQEAKFQSLFAEGERGRYINEANVRRAANGPGDSLPDVPNDFVPALENAEGELRRSSGTLFIPAEQTFRYRSPAAQVGAATSWLGFDWRTEMDAYLGSPSPVFRASAKNFLGQRAFPLAFDANPDVVYFASNAGRDTYGLYAVNLVTKQRTDFVLEDPHWDLADPADAFNESLLVFDRDGRLAGVRASTFDGRTKWVNPDLAEAQQNLEAMFSDRVIDIVDWDTSRRRFLVLVFSATDPGRYYLAEQKDGWQATELLRRSPGLTAARLNRSLPFAFDTPAGVHLTGTLTLPRRSRVLPPPLVVVCRDIPGRRETPEFSREIQAAAAMGFAVATVNYRGTAGFGTKHRDAVREGFDTIPAEDVRATVAWLTSHYAVNPRRVALVGYGFGGFVALRTAQLFPEEFRCVVSVNAPTDLMDWNIEAPMSGFRTLPDFGFEVRQAFFERSRLAGRSVTEHVTAKDRPAMIIQDLTRTDLRESQGLGLRNALRREGREVEYLPVNAAFTRGDPGMSARVFGQIAGFLNDHIYDFRVDLGTEKEVK